MATGVGSGVKYSGIGVPLGPTTFVVVVVGNSGKDSRIAVPLTPSTPVGLMVPMDDSGEMGSRMAVALGSIADARVAERAFEEARKTQVAVLKAKSMIANWDW